MPAASFSPIPAGRPNAANPPPPPVAAQPDYEWRVHIEPAPEDARATIDELEDFAHRCEDGTVTVEDMDRHDILSTLYFKPTRLFMFDAGSQMRR